MKPILYFLVFITYFGFLIFWAIKYPRRTPLKTEIENWMARPCFFGLYVTLPISALMGYFVIKDKSYDFVSIMIIMLPVILILIDYISTNPKRKSLTQEADEQFASLEFINNKPEQSFKGNQVEIILNQDYPFYASGYLVGVAINRICKNTYQEYFHVYQLKWGE
jgi:hypothetical protein